MNYAIENEYYPYADEVAAEEAFVIHVDESNEPIRIWDMTIDFSRALYKMDRSAYNEAFNNWLDSEMKERQMSVFKVHHLASDHIEYWYAEDEDEAMELAEVDGIENVTITELDA